MAEEDAQQRRREQNVSSIVLLLRPAFLLLLICGQIIPSAGLDGKIVRRARALGRLSMNQSAHGRC